MTTDSPRALRRELLLIKRCIQSLLGELASARQVEADLHARLAALTRKEEEGQREAKKAKKARKR